MKRKTRISELTIDDKLVEMRPINAHAVSRYRQAYRHGQDLGTLIVEADTLRVVSGNHRLSAMLEEFGPDHCITVEARKFASEAALLEVFAAENMQHGLPLNESQRRAISLAMAGEGVPVERIAEVFGVAVHRVQQWAGMSVVTVGQDGKRTQRPVKRGLEHKAGQRMKRDVYDQHWHHDRGIRAHDQAEQLTRWIRHDLIDWEDQRTADAMGELRKALNDVMVEAK